MQKLKNRRVVARLSRYKNALYRFRELGFERIYSDYLAEEVGVTPSQVRKDFSIFGITGNKRAGYKMHELIEKLEQLFHKDTTQRVIIAGAGRLGSAFSYYRGFASENIDIVAAFDVDPAKCSTSGDTPIYPLAEMEEFIKKENIEIAILTVPERVAEDVYRRMVESGVKGVLNFAPIPLKSTDTCIVTTFCVEVEIDNLIYFVNEGKEEALKNEESAEESKEDAKDSD